MAGIFSTSDRLGVVTGLAAEARAIGAAGRLCAGLSTANPERAAKATSKLIAEGATVIASIGFAAGLDPRQGPGSIIVADHVVAWPGRLPVGGQRQHYAEDASSLQLQQNELPKLSVAPRLIEALVKVFGKEVVVGTLVGLNEPVTSTDSKRALKDRTDGVAADMESHIVAKIAAQAGVPWFAVRIVTDPANRRVPPSALAALGAEGDVSVSRVLNALVRRPGDLPDLLMLAMDTGQAMRCLKQVGRALRAELN